VDKITVLTSRWISRCQTLYLGGFE